MLWLGGARVPVLVVPGLGGGLHGVRRDAGTVLVRSKARSPSRGGVAARTESRQHRRGWSSSNSTISCTQKRNGGINGCAGTREERGKERKELRTSTFTGNRGTQRRKLQAPASDLCGLGARFDEGWEGKGGGEAGLFIGTNMEGFNGEIRRKSRGGNPSLAGA